MQIKAPEGKPPYVSRRTDDAGLDFVQKLLQLNPELDILGGTPADYGCTEETADEFPD
ncbi:MAG: hypothetical protein ACOX7P_04290 [Oscillospiraceae bacterium]